MDWRAYRCSVSKSRSFVRSTWPVFIRTCVVARLTPFLNPASGEPAASWMIVEGLLTGPRHDCGVVALLSDDGMYSEVREACDRGW